MAHQVLMSALAFQRTNPDDPTVPVGEREIVKRGGLVPDYVNEFTIASLSAAGMIVPAPDGPDRTIRPVSEEPILQLPNPEVPPAPDFPRGTVTPVQVAKPKPGDPKPLWEAYAAQIGIPAGEAESMSKPKLIEAVNAKEKESATVTPPSGTEDNGGGQPPL